MELYKLGSRGEVVRQIQKALHLVPDGVYGQNTREAVIAFQRERGLTADGVVGPATLALLIPERLKKSRRTIKEVIIHCSDSPEGRADTVDDIRRWHTAKPPKGNGWSDIGYHYVIGINGERWTGRDVDLIGSHCYGHNTYSIGICYVGGRGRDGKCKDTRNLRQKAVLMKLINELKALYPQAKIYGHHDFAPGKQCPCFDAKTEYKNL